MAKSRISGGPEVTANMRQLANLVAGPGNSASKRALEPTLTEAKRNLQADGSVRTGQLLRDLIIKRQRSPKTKPLYRVGAGGDSTSIAHLVEFPVKAHIVGGIFAGAKHPGTPGTRFMTRAYDATKAEVVARWAAEIGPAIQKQAAVLARRAAKKAAKAAK
ncbi:MAG TPA: hypothetical protein VNX29_07110 [Kaistia sp.]|nr:hypothetical protein [Kaistia sp.]